LGTEQKQLQQLAQLYGLETSYYDIKGQHQQAEPDALFAVLRCLGLEIDNSGDVHNALRERKMERWQQCLEPVYTFFEGETPVLSVRLSAEQVNQMVYCKLELETGETRNWETSLSELPEEQSAEVEGSRYVLKKLELPPLPLGYHHFTLTFSSTNWETMVISAPERMYTLADSEKDRIWGLFIPLYALRSAHNWGVGDFSDMETLMQWAQTQGGGLVGTLPLLSTYLGQPFDPSPYAPVSKLFWNELYLDVARAPELEQCQGAQQLIQSAGFQEEIKKLRDGDLVDYAGCMAVKRQALEQLAECLFDGSSDRRRQLEQWLSDNPDAQQYARFRAAVEKMGKGWLEWPEQMQKELKEGDYDPAAERYHLYVQWLIGEQLGGVADRARQDGVGLYLDLPVGVHRSGFDTWWERDAFALTASAGSPPDDFLPEGQNWGLPPLHPQRIREQGYSYFIKCMRNHFRYAGVLRLDHVMMLHRLFWVPEGLGARDGVYVRYKAREFYAILALESSRYKTVLIGEDLGTVPDRVRVAMDKRYVYRMYVLPFELYGPKGAPQPVQSAVQASMNTHDMVPFAAFWESKNRDEQAAMANYLYEGGWITTLNPEAREVLQGWLKYLAASPAQILLISLEDLWLEKEPQNAPGDLDYPNWQRKAQHTLENLDETEGVIDALQEVQRMY
jgi:4-alpha-glucanotransferase